MQIKLIIICLAIFFNTSLLAKDSDTASKGSIPNWSKAELATLQSLWIGNLPALPIDTTNQYADNPQAAALGKKIFFDAQFSSNGKISCASCHLPENYFTDGKALSDGVGQTRRSSPSLLGVSYSPWFFWDGRADSQWSQALGPLENSEEHGGDRSQYAHLISRNSIYRDIYTEVFGPFPDLSNPQRFPANAGPTNEQNVALAWQKMEAEDKIIVNRIFVNIGKALAAYERLLLPTSTRFDRYVDALINNNQEKITSTLSANEIQGLKLFIGKASCSICHSGPLFTNHDFKNIGAPQIKSLGQDTGRFAGAKLVKKSAFNCLSDYSDADKTACDELRYIRFTRDDTLAAFKIPTLRNIANTAPYMHAGQFKTLTEVLKHYQNRPKISLGHNDLLLLDLSNDELSQLEDFLHTLSGAPPNI